MFVSRNKVAMNIFGENFSQARFVHALHVELDNANNFADSFSTSLTRELGKRIKEREMNSKFDSLVARFGR